MFNKKFNKINFGTSQLTRMRIDHSIIDRSIIVSLWTGGCPLAKACCDCEHEDDVLRTGT